MDIVKINCTISGKAHAKIVAHQKDKEFKNFDIALDDYVLSK